MLHITCCTDLLPGPGRWLCAFMVAFLLLVYAECDHSGVAILKRSPIFLAGLESNVNVDVGEGQNCNEDRLTLSVLIPVPEIRICPYPRLSLFSEYQIISQFTRKHIIEGSFLVNISSFAS